MGRAGRAPGARRIEAIDASRHLGHRRPRRLSPVSRSCCARWRGAERRRARRCGGPPGAQHVGVDDVGADEPGGRATRRSPGHSAIGGLVGAHHLGLDSELAGELDAGRRRGAGEESSLDAHERQGHGRPAAARAGRRRVRASKPLGRSARTAPAIRQMRGRGEPTAGVNCVKSTLRLESLHCRNARSDQDGPRLASCHRTVTTVLRCPNAKNAVNVPGEPGS